MSWKKVAQIVRPSAHPALIAPKQGIHWTYTELSQRVEAVAAQLQPIVDQRGGITIALGNLAENVVAQLAAAAAGCHITTVKITDDATENATKFTQCAQQLRCRHAFVAFDDAVQFGPVDNIVGVELGEDAASTDQEHQEMAFAYYNSVSSGTTFDALLSHGTASARELALTADDKVCVPVPLNHAMGFGFGLLAALSVGSTVVLPAALADSSATAAALRDEQCTVLLTDTHLMRALDTLPETESLAASANLRTGLVKIGSGEQFGLGEGYAWADTRFVTVGRPPAAAH
eukprot:g2217.t1